MEDSKPSLEELYQRLPHANRFNKLCVTMGKTALALGAIKLGVGVAGGMDAADMIVGGVFTSYGVASIIIADRVFGADQRALEEQIRVELESDMVMDPPDEWCV